MSDQAAISAVSTRAASGGILATLVLFAVSLAVVPIGSYYVSLKYLWNGNDTFAAITAIVAANAVLVTYILISWWQDKPEPEKSAASESQDKKTQ